MKFAIISDTHFGDPDCALVEAAGGVGGAYRLGEKYEAFRAAAGHGNDFLVALGDIFDFSIRSYADAYAAGKVFFEQLVADGIADQVIYVPGNHDFEFWHLVEHEVNVQRRMSRGEAPRQFRWSVPGILDDRTGRTQPAFRLPQVGEQVGGRGYGGLSLDRIAPDLRFNVAYPNLYFVNDEHSVLITHGHYLEPYWQLTSELMPTIAGDDLVVRQPMSMKDLVAINFPLNQLASSGVGQAGPLTDFVRRLQGEVRRDELTNVERWLDRLDDHVVDPLVGGSALDPREWLSDAFIGRFKRLLLHALTTGATTRYSDDFVTQPAVLERLTRYFRASLAEMHDLNAEDAPSGIAPLPTPRRLIWGHTHAPSAWRDCTHTATIEGERISLHNCGGWLYRREAGGRVFPGAEVFTYDAGHFASQRIG